MNSSRLQRIRAVARTETLRLVLDRSSIGLILLVPAVQLVLFGYAVNLTPRNVTLVVARSCELQRNRILHAVASTAAFTIVPTDRNLPPRQYISERLAMVAIGCDAGLPAIAADASGPTAVRPAVAVLQVGLLAEWVHEAIPGAPADPPVEWLYNPEGLTAWWLAPGLVGVVIMISMLMLGALTLVRDREQGSWEGLLATPVTGFDALIGKLSPYVIVAMAQAGVILALSRWMFAVPLAGSTTALILAAGVFALAHLALGFALSTVAHNQIQAVQAAVFFYLPSMLLSGFMFPFEGMPRWARIVGEVLPLTHFVRVTRNVLLKGDGAAAVAVEMWPVALFALAAAAMAITLYRRRLS